jgi:hypothetical protein
MIFSYPNPNKGNLIFNLQSQSGNGSQCSLLGRKLFEKAYEKYR